MSVIAMQVKTAENHPNADTLRLYSFEASGYETVQIIANLENIYKIGDVVAIALTDSVLKDGTKIKPTKLRGIYSFGMALGKVAEAIGTDLSEIYCQKIVSDVVEMQPWPSIELLYNLRRNLEIVGEAPKITYRAKIKLDGTNAGVQIFSDGRIAVQSRSQIITPKNDNAGFANWVSQNQDYFAKLAAPTPPPTAPPLTKGSHATIFGEWCGQGIQNRTAISKIDRKIFAVFAIQFGGVKTEIPSLEIRPEKIAEFLPQHPDIFVLPYYGEAIVLDFGNPEQLQAMAQLLNQEIEKVETVDPWVKETFGIEGLGEGLVFYPESDDQAERLSYTEMLFKAKGEKHATVKTKEPVQIKPEVAKNVEDFVNLVVTDPRLEQGITQACAGEFDVTKIGAFLQWFNADVQKESLAELEAAGLTWKDVNKAVMNAAKKWYLSQNKDRV